MEMLLYQSTQFRDVKKILDRAHGFAGLLTAGGIEASRLDVPFVCDQKVLSRYDDACGDVRVIQCSGDARLGGVVALALGEQVIVQVCVENDLFCHGIPLLSDYCRQRTGFGVRMRGQIREKRGQISEKCSLLRLPPVLGGGDP